MGLTYLSRYRHKGMLPIARRECADARHRALLSACSMLFIGVVVGMGNIGLVSAGPLFHAGSLDATRDDPANDQVAGMDQSEAAQELLRAMADAMKTLNYEGTFVHVHGSNIRSMSILHANDGQGELERMRALDGEAREVYRDKDTVTCIWPASQSVVVSKSRPRNLLPELHSLLSENDHYAFSIGMPDRVAGLSTHVVNVEPADSHRYGYRFWIDQRNYMLLRSMLLDGRRAVEQFMFTYIEYPVKIDPARFDINREKEQISWLEPNKLQATLGLEEDSSEDQIDRVGFSKLPMGYREVSETYTSMPINEVPVSHVMLSDGMASVSVYVEYSMQEGRFQSIEGLSNMGAVNAYGLRTDDVFITAVGEVPAGTVQAIARAVRIR